MAVRAKRIEYEGGIGEGGELRAGPGSAPVSAGEGWSSESLVLAALCRCSLASLRFAAKRADVVVEGSAHARGVVTLREEDGVYALVEARITMDVRLDPPPEPDALAQLVRRTARGCFVGQSLRATPAYTWRINGVEVPG